MRQNMVFPSRMIPVSCEGWQRHGAAARSNLLDTPLIERNHEAYGDPAATKARVSPRKTACFAKHSSAVRHSGPIPIGTVVTLFDDGSVVRIMWHCTISSSSFTNVDFSGYDGIVVIRFMASLSFAGSWLGVLR